MFDGRRARPGEEPSAQCSEDTGSGGGDLKRLREVLQWTAAQAENETPPLFCGQAMFRHALDREGLLGAVHVSHEVARAAPTVGTTPWQEVRSAEEHGQGVSLNVALEDDDEEDPPVSDGDQEEGAATPAAEGDQDEADESPDGTADDDYRFPVIGVDPPIITIWESWCCCPVDIKMRGANDAGGFAIKDPSKRDKRFPGCEGTDFNVEIRVKWVLCETFSPSTLEWWEEHTTQNKGFPAGTNSDLYAAGQKGSRHVDDWNGSPTFIPWWQRMDPKYPLSYTPAQSEATLQSALAWAAHEKDGMDLILPDTPCFAPFQDPNAGMVYEREILGKVVVKGGDCDPPCKPKSVGLHWAQYVSFNSDTGKFENLVFDTDGYKGDAKLGPEHADEGSADVARQKREKWRALWARGR